MLGRLGDHVWTADARGENGAANGEVVRLRPGPGEHDPIRGSTDKRRDLGPGRAERVCRSAGVPMRAGRIAELGDQVRLHRLRNSWVDRGGCVVVEVHRPVDKARMCGVHEWSPVSKPACWWV